MRQEISLACRSRAARGHDQCFDEIMYEDRAEPTLAAADPKIDAACDRADHLEDVGIARAVDDGRAHHDGVRQQYDRGIHAAKLKIGDSRAPSCADCHAAHTIQRADTAFDEMDNIADAGIANQLRAQLERLVEMAGMMVRGA